VTVFWLSAAALALAAVALVLRPWFRRRADTEVSRSAANLSIYRDQLRELEADLAAGKLARADYERARIDLESRLLEDVRAREDPKARQPVRRGIAIAVGVGVPLVAFAVYFWIGNPGAIQQTVEHDVSVAQIEAMVDRLAARMRENPGDVDGWQLLARSYGVLGRFQDAANAYEKAASLAPRDAQLLADYADALAMARGRRLEGEPEKLIQRALQADPNNLKALALAGTAAYERKDYAGAAAHWQRMLPHVAPDSEDARSIQQNINEARSFLKDKAPPAAGLAGTVSLAPAMKDKSSPDDIVFVFARAAEGPPMPLAVARTRVRDLPYRFQLDDSMAMTPALKLSAFPKVTVTARISKGGAPTAQPGDLQGVVGPVTNDARDLRVIIDTEVR
jgi:cytochrome c-type biogenesis protein CcmH